MANPKHLAILERGVKAWNRWRKDHPDIRENLSEANFHRATIAGANLFHADLTGANLVAADLHGADLDLVNLHAADLGNANLTEASLYWADLTSANLHGADLRATKLIWADLTGASLGGANLTGALVGNTTFANLNLSSARGLESLEHSAPSTIGIDTIYKSQGKIPQIFLRGAGVPENFIEYMASLVGTGIEFYSLFISYSTKDQEFANRLHADLQAKGVRCWFAPHDMRSGKKVHEQIDEAIRMHDKLLLILSPASMDSEWVKTEISKARKREVRDGKRVLFPIRLCPFETLRDWECFDSDAGKHSAREIREYFIPDFSNWKDHDAYMLAFNRLLKDLQGVAPNPAP